MRPKGFTKGTKHNDYSFDQHVTRGFGFGNATVCDFTTKAKHHGGCAAKSEVTDDEEGERERAISCIRIIRSKLVRLTTKAGKISCSGAPILRVLSRGAEHFYCSWKFESWQQLQDLPRMSPKVECQRWKRM